MLLALAFAFNAATFPHAELPATFTAGRAFVTPRVANAGRRLVLWVDTDGSGFVRGSLVQQLRLQTTAQHAAYLPRLDEREFPAIRVNYGALPVLEESEIGSDPIFSGVDGQLGWTWLTGRIWTLDYPGKHFYLDYTAPPYRQASRVPLQFDAAHRYPRLNMVIGGHSYTAALDTAATVALSASGLAAVGDGGAAVRATSFVPGARVAAWHKAHPDWRYVARAGSAGVSMIRVPIVQTGRVVFHDVWFSTRPSDDVFAGNSVDLKLGPSAYQNCAVTIDYVHDDAVFDC